MNKRIEQIRQRRDMLVMRAELQRNTLVLHIEPWKKPLHYLDHGVTLARRARAHPALITLALAGLAFIGRNYWGSALRLSWTAWNVYRLFIKAKL